MKEKFKKWRNNLTGKQKVILWIIGAIIYVLFWICSICLLKVNNSKTVRIIAAIIFLILAIIAITVVAIGGAFVLVSVVEKLTDKKLLKRYKEKLSEDEFTEVFFKSEIQAPSGDAGELYWDMKHCEEPHWFAKWKDDNVYVVLKDRDKEVRKWPILSLYFFDYYFEDQK